MDFHKLFARDLTLSLIQQIHISQVDPNISSYLNTYPIENIDSYFITHAHDGYCEQFYSVELAHSVKNAVVESLKDETFMVNMQEDFAHSYATISSFDHTIPLALDDFNIVHTHTIKLLSTYFILQYIADLNLPTYDTYQKVAQNLLLTHVTLLALLNDISVRYIVHNFEEVSKYNRFILASELLEKSIPSIEVLEERSRDYWFVKGDLITHSDMVPLTKKQIEKTYNVNFLDPKIYSTNRLIGVPASSGKYTGPAKIILDLAHIPEIDDGDILVTSMSTPHFIPLMRKAGAFIADEGGALSHAAIVAREYNKPCVVATQFATKVLKDGDLVEVDADNGVVTRVKP